VKSAEANEARGTVQLSSLQALADAMDCDLVYALVPRGSLGEVMERQAERIAERLVRRVSESMELEEQGVDMTDRRRQVQELKADILRDRRRDFWDV
jgi:predicted DNA-binding mobile mystery protein A